MKIISRVIKDIRNSARDQGAFRTYTFPHRVDGIFL